MIIHCFEFIPFAVLLPTLSFYLMQYKCLYLEVSWSEIYTKYCVCVHKNDFYKCYEELSSKLLVHLSLLSPLILSTLPWIQADCGIARVKIEGIGQYLYLHWSEKSSEGLKKKKWCTHTHTNPLISLMLNTELGSYLNNVPWALKLDTKEEFKKYLE